MAVPDNNAKCDRPATAVEQSFNEQDNMAVQLHENLSQLQGMLKTALREGSEEVAGSPISPVDSNRCSLVHRIDNRTDDLREYNDTVRFMIDHIQL